MSVPQASWTILATLRWTADYFRTKGVSEARASAEILLAHTLGVSRLDLYLRYDQPLNPEELARFKALMVRRREGEPVAYLTGHREFWSLDIQVTPAVLIPRPETETLVAAALEAAKICRGGFETRPYHRGNFPNDIGLKKTHRKPKTENRKPPHFGAWRLASAAARWSSPWPRNCPGWPGWAWTAPGPPWPWPGTMPGGMAVLDRVHFLQADLLAALKPTAAFALLVANLPYVPRAEWERLPREIKAFEPPGALLGGEDGLDLIRPLIRQAQQYVMGGGWVLLEVGDQQAPQVAALVEETGAYDRIETIKDFSGMERVVRARRRDGTG